MRIMRLNRGMALNNSQTDVLCRGCVTVSKHNGTNLEDLRSSDFYGPPACPKNAVRYCTIVGDQLSSPQTIPTDGVGNIMEYN